MLKKFLRALALVAAALTAPVDAFAEPRLALVIGEEAYRTGDLPTAANDAGLVAQTLQSAGFEVVQGRDLGANELRQIVRDFLDRAQSAGPDTSAVVYISGHGLQLEGENYLVPIDARITRDSDVPIEGFRLSDLMRSLAAAPVRARIVIIDAARDYPLASTGQPIAKGLGLVEAPQGFLVAFSQAPDMVTPDGKGPYGAYAAALVEMMREPGITLDDLFARVRLRVHEKTGGRQTPWSTANLNGAEFTFFEPVEATAATPPIREKRIASAGPEEAYALAVEQDTIQAYQDFLRTYPGHPLARRVKVMLAARRETVVWRRTASRNTANAYWTYLKLYPNGPHAPDCRRRLARLSAPFAPPAEFEEIEYVDLPPPLPVIETVEVTHWTTTTYFEELPPPPPPPVDLLPPPSVEVVTIISAPPPPPPALGILPIPVPIPIPVRAAPPPRFYPPVAPVTPQGPVVIPVANPPVINVANTTAVNTPQTVPAPRPAPPAVQAAPVAAAQPPAAVAGQPGLQAPIRPFAAIGATGAGAPGRPLGRPAGGAAHPEAPGAHGAPSGQGTGAPAASLPAPVHRAGDAKPTAGKPSIQVLSPISSPAGAKLPGAPPAATAAHTPPQLKDPAGAASPPNKGLKNAQPPLEPASAPKPPFEATRLPPATTAPFTPGPQRPRPGVVGPTPVPHRTLPAASLGGPPPQAVPRPTRPPAAVAPRPAPPPVAALPRPASPHVIAPRPVPPPVAAAPRPAPPFAAVPRPVPPPIMAPRPAPAPVAIAPRPAPPVALAPRPAPPPAVAPKPAPPPVAAAAPRPAPGGPPGAAKKCVLPNGQPCPR